MAKKKQPTPPKHPYLAKSRSLKIVKFFVALIWYLSWFGALLLTALIVAMAAGFDPDNLHIDAPLNITYVENGDDHKWIEFENRPAVISVKGMAKVNMPPLGRFGLLARFPWAAVVLGLFIWGVSYLRKIIKTLQTGAPFDPQNPHRLRMIGFITILTGPVAGFGVYLQGLYMVRDLYIPGAHLDVVLDLHGDLIFLGLIILVIAQVFDVAVNMQREHDLTI